MSLHPIITIKSNTQEVERVVKLFLQHIAQFARKLMKFRCQNNGNGAEQVLRGQIHLLEV